MTDPDVVTIDDSDIESEEQESDPPRRSLWALRAIIVLLLLLLFSCSTASEIWMTGGKEEARFIARNLECLKCHIEKIPDFAKPAVHNPFARKECTTCHTIHGSKVGVSVTRAPRQWLKRYSRVIQWLPLKWWFSLSESEIVVGEDTGSADSSDQHSKLVKGAASGLIMTEWDLCLACHGSMGAKLSEAYPHGPFVERKCVTCHDPHASDFSALLTQSPDKLCLECHDVGMELARNQTHPPALKGWCIRCHDPHASEFEGMIVSGQRELCFSCHPTVSSKEGMAVQHVPFLNGDCTGCHQPHGSDYLSLLNAVQPDLCYDCHPQIENQFAQPSHHPVGVTMRCGSCHDPHAAQYSALLVASDNTFCYQCHGEVSVTFDPSAHGLTLCVQCHTPHGSVNAPMLRASNPSLCLGCHESEHFDERETTVYRNNHPVQPTHYDVNSRDRLTCTSSCHDPHGTTHTSMLRYFDYPDDGNCLMCHAVARGNRVGIDY